MDKVSIRDLIIRRGMGSFGYQWSISAGVKGGTTRTLNQHDTLVVLETGQEFSFDELLAEYDRRQQ